MSGEDIRAKVERSSLGTPEAKALRATVSDEQAARVVARAKELAAEHHAQIFSEGSFLKGTLTWGWQCFTCRAEETGLGTATTAQERADEHEDQP